MRSKTTGLIVFLLITSLAWLNYYEHEKLKAARSRAALLAEKVRRLESLLEQAKLPVIPDKPADSRILKGREYEAAVEAFERGLHEGEVQPPPSPPEPVSAEAPEVVTAINAMKQGSLIRTRSRAASKMLDAAVFEALDLSGDRLEQFKVLVMERKAAANEYAIQFMSPDLTDQAREELAEQASGDLGAIDAAFKSFLGEESYNAYQALEASRTGRIQHSVAVLALADEGAALDAAQEQDLLDLMISEMDGFPSLASIGSTKGFEQMLSNSNLADDRISDYEAFHAAVGAGAEVFLNPGQYSLLRENLAQQLMIRKAGLTLMANPVPGAE